MVGIERRKVNWIVDADIKGFFDTIDHGWLMKFIEHRIADPRLLRLLRKWLRAGVSEQGEWAPTTVGTPQGAVISPLLANIYLHQVLDVWMKWWRSQDGRGETIIVRYADDFVVGFQHKTDAEQFLHDLRERLAKFALTLHPDKTRLIEFGRFAAGNRLERGEGKPETFNFLGFTHRCAKRRSDGRFTVIRTTMTKRLGATVQRDRPDTHGQPGAAHRRTRTMADFGGTRMAELPRGPWKQRRHPRLQRSGHRRMATITSSSQPASRKRHHLGDHAPTFRTIPAPDQDPAPLPQRALMRHHLMEEPYAVIPHVRICAGPLQSYVKNTMKTIYGDPP